MVSELKPWFGVATPHEDIREGRLSEAVFAANLWAVVQGNAPEVYRDPEAFFSKTYLTAGLTNVLKKAARALSGDADAGDRILSLQTAFGGGKTHTLVALWHLARGYAPLSRSVGEGSGVRAKVAVFTNETCDATQGRQTPEGIHTRTLWGELALQLGGVELYRKIEANDQARTVPQGLFVEILQKAAPCLILLDEVADYSVGASAVEVGNATLADQTISFAQQLTQAVQQVKGVALVATLPASHLEVASSEKGQEILNRLERRFGRMSADIKPVADDEIYEVVRRRLFESVGDSAEHEKVADAYLKMYQQHKNEVPTEATRGTYKERIVAAYPFHPTLIDALYLRWGSHGDFQRTRGVLRLLASIIGDLWQRRNTETQSQPLIQPCHVRWTIDALHSALTRLWGAAYEAVVAADVIGEKANAPLLDAERGGDNVTEKTAQGLASAILLGSFRGQGERAGFSTKDLRLCVGRPTLNWGYTDGALLALEDERAFFLHTASAGNLGKRYWFGAKPTLTKLIVQYRNQFASQDFNAEIIETAQEQVKSLPSPRALGEGAGVRATSPLSRSVGEGAGVRAEPTWRVLVNPEADLPEQRSLTLLVMPPDYAYAENGGELRLMASPVEQRLLNLSEKCGRGERHYRNTLLFLLPTPRGLGRLRSALREVAALEAVKHDYGSQLDSEQRDELNKRLDAARKAVTELLGSAYTHVARIEGQSVAVSALSDAKPTFSEHLQFVWKQVIEEEEWVLRRVGTVTLQKVGLVPTEGGIRIKDAIEAFLRYTDKPMIASREAVLEGLTQACQDRLIGIGYGINLNNLQKKWCGEDVTLDPNEEGLWVIPPFEPEPAPGPRPDDDKDKKIGDDREKDKKGDEDKDKKPNGDKDDRDKAKPVRRITIKGRVPLESWSDVFRCFISPVARMNLKRLRLGIDFEMETQDGQSIDENDPTLKALKESARQLGLTLGEE
jgi:hypothetical protein